MYHASSFATHSSLEPSDCCCCRHPASWLPLYTQCAQLLLWLFLNSDCFITSCFCCFLVSYPKLDAVVVALQLGLYNLPFSIHEYVSSSSGFSTAPLTFHEDCWRWCVSGPFVRLYNRSVAIFLSSVMLLLFESSKILENYLSTK